MHEVAVILNPFAGPRCGKLSAQRVESLLADVGCRAEILKTTGPGVATELARQAAERFPVVIAAGGDGTVHEVATGLLGTDATLGLMPGGSGDDFAFGLGINSAAEGAAAVSGGRARRIDVGFLDDRPFVNTAGFFLSGLVCRRAARVWRAAGHLRYILASMRTLPFWRGQDASWRLDGEPEPRTGRWLLAEVCNCPRSGGGFRLAPDADPGDGLLDFSLIRQVGLFAVAKIFPKAARGERIKHPGVSVPVARGGVLELERETAAHLDGEPFVLAAGRHHFRIEAACLPVMVNEST